MTDQPEATKPKMPENASEAASALLSFLPHVQHTDNRYYFGYHKNGKPVFIQSSIDRALVTGTLQGIADGRIALGSPQLLGSINAAFFKPLNDALSSPPETAGQPNPDAIENRKLLDKLCAGVEHAARFGLFIDQPLNVARSRLNGVGFGATEKSR